MKGNRTRKQGSSIFFEKIVESSKLYGIALCYCFLIGNKVIGYFPIGSPYFCVRDFFVMMMYPMWYSVILLVPVTMTTIFLIKHDFLPMCIIQNDSWKFLLWKQQKKICFQSLLYSLVFLGIIFFGTIGMKLSNWNQMGSYFYERTERISEIGNIEFLMIVFIVSFIRNLIMSEIVLLSVWKKNTPIYGVIIVCIVICFESIMAKYPILFRLFAVDYRMWVDQSFRIQMLIGLVVYTGIFVICLKRIVRKKELMRNEKI